MRRCLERQKREIKERRRRRAEEKRVQQEDDEQVAMAVGKLDLSSQGLHRGSQISHGLNVDRHRHSWGKNLLKDYAILNSMYFNVDFRGRYRMQPYLFKKVMHDVCNFDAHFVRKCDAAGVLGLLTEQKLTTALRMLAFGASVDQMDEIARMGKSTTLESMVRFCDAIKTLHTRDYLRKPTPRDLQRLLQKAEA
ncbi:unnamed protein product [Prunus brigantina]